MQAPPRDDAVGAQFACAERKHDEERRELRTEAILDPAAEAAGQIADHLQTAPRPQALRVRAIVRDDAIDDRSDDGEPDLDRSLPAFEMRMLRGIGHELTDNEGEAPAALRLEWQAVGAQRETNPDRPRSGIASAR